MPFGMGIGEFVLILVVLLLIFGAKRLPELGGALGKGIREFKSSVTDLESEVAATPDEKERELKAPRGDAGERTDAPAPEREPVEADEESRRL